MGAENLGWAVVMGLGLAVEEGSSSATVAARRLEAATGLGSAAVAQMTAAASSFLEAQAAVQDSGADQAVVAAGSS